MIRTAIACAAAIGLGWAALVAVTGGIALSWPGLHVSSTDPIRPLIVAMLLAAVYALASGRQRLRDDAALALSFATPARLTALLAIAIGGIAIWKTSWTASGSDAYAYVTQADLWLSGKLTVPVPMADEVPWPRPLATFVPFGYAAVAGDSAIASIVGPGLPLLMALMKAVGGHAALFLVVPLTAALLIWCTFAIGRQLATPFTGLGAAWLVATSPTLLAMIKEPMSDVPAAAFWALATWKVLDASRVSAGLGGVAAAIAILIRPNLVPLAAVLGMWVLWRRDVRTTAIFAVGVVSACVSVALINATLFGSPLASGYGATRDLFTTANVLTNVRRYGAWLAQTQTPLIFAGGVALLLPSPRLWPASDGRRGALLLAAFAIAAFVIYLPYTPFGAWWFLRFLLPAWPALCIGTAALLLSAIAATRVRGLAPLAVIALGLYTASLAHALHVFPDNEGERRYATIAQLVEQATEPTSIILASAHTGPLRYYAGRDTMRFDLLDEAWLDRAVAWLSKHGRHPYFLIEDWERPMFVRRFAAMNALGRLDEMSPMLAYRAYRIPGTVFLFDPSRPTAVTLELPPIRDPRPRCPLPAQPPALSVNASKANF